MIVYEKEVAQLSLEEARVVDETKFVQEMTRETEKPKQTSRERRKRFAEERWMTSSGCQSGLSKECELETLEEARRQGRRHTHTCKEARQEERVRVPPRKQYSAHY